MEITKFIRRLGWRSVLLIVVPVMAALGAAVWASTQPSSSVASATVVTPVAGQETPAVVLQFVTDFGQAIDSDAVLDSVAEQTGVSVAQLRAGLSVSRLNTSGVIRVQYRVDEVGDGVDISEVPAIAANEAMTAVLTPQSATADAQVASTSDELERRLADLEEFRDSTGFTLPDDDYRSLNTEISQLRVASDIARAADDSARADRLDDVIAEREEQRRELASAVVQYERLTTSVNTARQARDDALTSFARSDALDVVVRSGDLVDVADVRRIDTTAASVQAAVTAGAVAFVLTLLLLVVLVRRGARSAGGVEAGPAAHHAHVDSTLAAPTQFLDP